MQTTIIYLIYPPRFWYNAVIACVIGIEVNFMDDVGQTLLNWASAFGTQEMVEFLCDRGADVNKGEICCVKIGHKITEFDCILFFL